MALRCWGDASDTEANALVEHGTNLKLILYAHSDTRHQLPPEPAAWGCCTRSARVLAGTGVAPGCRTLNTPDIATKAIRTATATLIVAGGAARLWQRSVHASGDNVQQFVQLIYELTEFINAIGMRLN